MIERQARIVCDYCGMTSSDSAPTSGAARKLARADGWGYDGSNDACQACVLAHHWAAGNLKRHHREALRLPPKQTAR